MSAPLAASTPQDTSQREADMAIINSVQTALVARLEMQDICNIVGDKIQQIFDAQVVSIALLDKERNEFDVQYFIERDLRVAPHTLAVFGFRKHIIETKQSLLIDENVAEEAIRFNNPVVRGEIARSAAFIPMINGDQVTGVVTLQHLEREHAFSDADVILLKTVTNTLSVALENARLFAETERLLKFSQDRAADLEILNRVQTALANRTAEQNIYDIVGDQIHEIFDAQVVDIALFDEENDLFFLPYSIERRVRFPEMSIPNVGYRHHVISTRKTLVINEQIDYWANFYGNPGVIYGEVPRSALFVPMVTNDHAVGVISLQNLDREQAFTAADVTFLSTLANSLSGALENARLFDKTQTLLKLAEDRANDLEVIGSIGRQFTASLNMNTVFAALESNLQRMLKVSTFFVLLSDPVDRRLNMVFGMEAGEPLPAFSLALEDEHAQSSRCARQRSAVLQEFLSDPEQQLVGQKVNLSALFVPLIIGERLLGVMSVQTLEAHAYGEREQSFCQTLCSYLAIALDNAAALDAQHAAEAARADALLQANVTLEQLGTIGREITGNLEEVAVLASLNTHVGALLDAQSYRIYRLERGADRLRLVYGVESGQTLPLQSVLLDDEPTLQRCIREQRAVVGVLDHGSYMVAPLMTGAQVLGVMITSSSLAHAYDERDVGIFRTLCAYCAIALANSDALAALRTAQAMIIQQEKMASLGQLVANVAHEINTPIGAIKSSGQSIADALSHMLHDLPRMMQQIDPATQLLFMEMIARAGEVTTMLSTREERALVRSVTDELELAGLDEARDKAAVLVQLHAHLRWPCYLPLLQHPRSDFILETAASMAAIVSSAGNINTAVERVAKIVFALKSYSRVDSSGVLHEADLPASLDTVLTIYQNQIKQGVDVIRNYAMLAPVRCLPDELNQVWTNLIHNALQAMQNKGTLTIQIEQVGEEAVVAIRDTGSGIAPEIRERIFDAFFTTKPAGEGSGLGLDIVKKIVEKHRGRITVESEVGVGTTFSVLLPMG